MDTYKQFKSSYKKQFLVNPEFLATELILTSDDIPTRMDGYKTAIVQAYNLLSICTARDIGHLKILINYEKLLKKNREYGMNTNPLVFATMLYILHHYCVRILRSPWRKDYFTIKTYNGFYQYTLCKNLSPPVIEELLSYIGFEYKPQLNIFMLTFPTLNRQAIHSITEAGIGFFLSYSHCMMSNDSQFKKSVKELKHALMNAPMNPPLPKIPTSPSRSHNFDRPSTSGYSESRNGVGINEDATPLQNSARDKRREKRARDMESRNLHENDTRIQNRFGDASSSSSFRDIYGSQVPIDLSTRTPYRHTVNRNAGDVNSTLLHGGSPHSDYMDDQELYGSQDTKLTSNYKGGNDRDLSPENSLNGQVLYPPNTTRQSNYSLDAQMENICVDDDTRQRNLVIKTSSEVKFPPNNHAASLSTNYVKFYPRRGSPDGEMTSEGLYDYQTTGRQYRAPKSQPRSLKPRGHIYQEIDDRNLYDS